MLRLEIYNEDGEVCYYMIDGAIHLPDITFLSHKARPVRIVIAEYDLKDAPTFVRENALRS